MTSFTAPEHIRRRADFEQAYDAGVRVSGRFLTIFVRQNAHKHPRLGIAATRKIGGSVDRNRAKRLVRELFRHHKPTTGLDIVVVPRREALNAPYLSLEREFGTLLERALRADTGAASARPRRPRRSRADSRV